MTLASTLLATLLVALGHCARSLDSCPYEDMSALQVTKITDVASAARSPACSANAACSHLAGDCCPTSDGVMLACCSSASSPSVPSLGSSSTRPSSAGAGYFPHFDTSPDYLNIGSGARGVAGNGGRPSDNYYLVIGDYGACGGNDECAEQSEIAEMMRRYVSSRRQANPNSTLSFVLAVGDNFYWTGASSGRFSSTWRDVYKELADVPWFAVMGNHDYGDSDPGAACASLTPRFECSDTNQNSAACGGARPYSTEAQSYDSNQLNADKGGVDGSVRANFHMPDFTYFYTIPALDFELIAMDWNWEDRNGLGGRGSACTGCGAYYAAKHCGSADVLDDGLKQIQDASTRLLRNRSLAAEHGNVAIIGHYPDAFQGGANFRTMYLQDSPEANVFNFYGHTHVQQCEGTDESGQCVDFLTGGGGGCCSTGDTPAGFAVISWDDNRRQLVECFNGVSTLGLACTALHYSGAGYRRGAYGAVGHERLVCNFTNDHPPCPNYAGPVSHAEVVSRSLSPQS
uniref:Calcineurin-like phosphoesterase domain-containing protein n=1 Tax=Pyrodinium bahamense TaxID=73915 RepID=A0A7S0G0S4_9DINO|mmetsp:Transcript_8891/g.24639  ORF Transcript_8891/g.24639 Transcript_8891/m.24639 type:complete len:515 (+) Transcript_8891:60-1604(+)